MADSCRRHGSDSYFAGSPKLYSAVLSGMSTEIVGCNEDGTYYAWRQDAGCRPGTTACGVQGLAELGLAVESLQTNARKSTSQPPRLTTVDPPPEQGNL